MLRFNSSLLIYLWAGHESCFCRSWWWQFNHCSNGPNKPSILSYLTTRGSFVLLRTSPTNTNNERHHIQQSAGYFHSEESETKRWQKKKLECTAHSNDLNPTSGRASFGSTNQIFWLKISLKKNGRPPSICWQKRQTLTRQKRNRRQRRERS